MKIIAVLEDVITTGGAFNQSLNAIIRMSRICQERFEFEVFSTHAANINYLKQLGINCTLANVSFKDRLLAILVKSSLWPHIRSRIKFCGPFEKKINEHKGDLVYFLAQSQSSEFLQDTNFITTVFDLCHRDTPEFPEVRSFGEFRGREQHLKNNISQALIIITESDQLSALISARYGIDRERCLAMPLSSSPFLQAEFSVDKGLVMKKYEMTEGYFFYPGQFWSHKNHIRILEALIQLRSSGVLHRVVFSGGDQGNRAHIENFVSMHSLEDQVRFLGFVPADDMRGLYEGSVAVIMPTYFGPTNIPPLEAWLTRKPLIYSAHLKEQAGDAAISVDPDDALQLAEAMIECTKKEKAELLIELGDLRLKSIARQCESSEKELLIRLARFEVRRRCWA
ncbi:MAG: glycosyltransferase [Sideroxydans sp.]|jgi:glycosyltransferase involved in cell wall biosynthesis